MPVGPNLAKAVRCSSANGKCGVSPAGSAERQPLDQSLIPARPGALSQDGAPWGTEWQLAQPDDTNSVAPRWASGFTSAGSSSGLPSLLNRNAVSSSASLSESLKSGMRIQA